MWIPKTEGPTRLTYWSFSGGRRGTDIRISVVSYRLARFLIEQTRCGRRYSREIYSYRNPVEFDGYVLVGFSPFLGCHIAVRDGIKIHRQLNPDAVAEFDELKNRSVWGLVWSTNEKR